MIRVGSYKGHWDGPAHVLTGGISGFHPIKGVPYSIRERARLQGFPDDFVFYGTVLGEEDGQRVWNHDKNMHMVKQTGKAMPIQFCTYVSMQIASHITLGVPAPATNARVIPPNEYVSEAKTWYCQNVGYADQTAACASCWLAARCEIRTGRYGITLPEYSAVPGLPTRSSDKARTLQEDQGKPATQKVTADSRAQDPKRKLNKNNNIALPGQLPLPFETAAKSKKPLGEGRHKRRPLYRPVATTMLEIGGKK